MHRIGFVCLFLLCSLALPLPSAAQDVSDAINYCAGELTYNLPEGWVAGEQIHTPYGASIRLASSEAALRRAVLEDGDAVIIVNVTGRGFLTQSMRLEMDADLVDILEGVTAQAPAAFHVDAVTTVTLPEQLAASVAVRSDALDMVDASPLNLGARDCGGGHRLRACGGD